MRSYTKNLQLKRKNYKDWRPAVPISAKGENFLNFEPFFGDLLPCFILFARSGGDMFPVPHPKYATAPRTAADSKYATFLQDGALEGSKFTILQKYSYCGI